jgi:uncharacterized membrane protein
MRAIITTVFRVMLTLLAAAISAYAGAYLVFHERMFPPPLRQSFLDRPWGIYPHALFGAVALILGSIQFFRRILVRWPGVHRVIGTIYVVAALLTGLAGLYMSRFAFGGVGTRMGFATLAVVLLVTTSLAYAKIRKGNIVEHREWMLRSYALIFAAVTLRIELPLLQSALHAFPPAYAVVAWLCWVPNLLTAEVLILSTRKSQRSLLQALRAA